MFLLRAVAGDLGCALRGEQRPILSSRGDVSPRAREPAPRQPGGSARELERSDPGGPDGACSGDGVQRGWWKRGAPALDLRRRWKRRRSGRHWTPLRSDGSLVVWGM